ncbi:hypothetical protein SAMN05421846_101197 [Chryseobacterium taeanense]|uniref:Uncharacterized protein n=1 Tax=Chryseobacterium taeanense TaxID=311334 RepID=A0A1G8DIM2_9FLAO|nr:hypothetical protein SAMN05421846_101197 [Chryseobacterium taeanense]
MAFIYDIYDFAYYGCLNFYMTAKVAKDELNFYLKLIITNEKDYNGLKNLRFLFF